MRRPCATVKYKNDCADGSKTDRMAQTVKWKQCIQYLWPKCLCCCCQHTSSRNVLSSNVAAHFQSYNIETIMYIMDWIITFGRSFFWAIRKNKSTQNIILFGIWIWIQEHQVWLSWIIIERIHFVNEKEK